jgi:hypothetical protein
MLTDHSDSDSTKHETNEASIRAGWVKLFLFSGFTIFFIYLWFPSLAREKETCRKAI